MKKKDSTPVENSDNKGNTDFEAVLGDTGKIDFETDAEDTGKIEVNIDKLDEILDEDDSDIDLEFIDIGSLDKAAPKGRKKKKRRLPIPILILIIFFSLVVIAYFAGVVFFYGRYGMHTTINGEDAFRMKPEEVKQLLEEKASDWSLTLTEKKAKCGVLRANLIGLTYDASDIENHPAQNPWLWPEQFFNTYDIEVKIEYAFDKTSIDSLIGYMSFEHMNPSDFDAGIVYSEEYFNVVDSSVDVIDKDKLVSAVNKKIEETALLSEEVLTYEVTDDDVYMSTPDNLYEAAEAANDLLGAKITYCFDGGVVIDRDQIAAWVNFDNDLNPFVDETLVQEWIDELYAKYEDQKIVRYIKNPYGDVTEYSGGTYGYEIITDTMLEDIMAAIAAKEEVELYDFGNDYCEVDISAQHMWYIIDGVVKFDAPVITGSYGYRETSRGQWCILEKVMNKVLRGDYDASTGTYEYETPVTYWMRVTWSGIGFHDATWQPAFGGQMYAQGYGSHGCINMSYSAAQTLYSLVWVGMPVIVHN